MEVEERPDEGFGKTAKEGGRAWEGPEKSRSMNAQYAPAAGPLERGGRPQAGGEAGGGPHASGPPGRMAAKRQATVPVPKASVWMRGAMTPICFKPAAICFMKSIGPQR